MTHSPLSSRSTIFLHPYSQPPYFLLSVDRATSPSKFFMLVHSRSQSLISTSHKSQLCLAGYAHTITTTHSNTDIFRRTAMKVTSTPLTGTSVTEADFSYEAYRRGGLPPPRYVHQLIRVILKHSHRRHPPCPQDHYHNPCYRSSASLCSSFSSVRSPSLLVWSWFQFTFIITLNSSR